MKPTKLLARSFAACSLIVTALAAHAQVNTWTYVAHLNTPRSDAAAATAPNGKIYVFGGITDASANLTATAEAYDPALDTWTSVASMPTTLLDENAVTGKDGLIYLIGGQQTFGTPASKITIYDPSTDSYTQSSSSTPINMTTSTAALGSDGKIYVFADPGTGLTTYSYDTATDTWKTLAAAPSAIPIVPKAVADKSGLIYVVGGFLSGGFPDGTSFIYDPHADAWTQIADCRDHADQGAAVGGDGRVYELAGSGDPPSCVQFADAYDPSSGSWHTIPDLQVPRIALTSATDNEGRVYAIGGTFETTGPGFIYDSVERFTPALLSGNADAINAQEGNAFNGEVAKFTDKNLNQSAISFTASIDWGDGTAPTTATVAAGANLGDFTVSGIHTYAEEGSYPTAITVNDADSESLKITGAATVADAPFTATALNISASTNIAFSGKVATFSDSNPLSSPADFSASIDWGDGTTSTGTITLDPSGGFDVSGSHTYTAVGPYATAIKIVDEGGLSGTVQATATVVVPPPAVTAGVINAIEGSPFTGQVATFTDADPTQTAGNFAATINWGDGATSPGTVTSNGAGGFIVTGTHVYAEEGAYSTMVTVAVQGSNGSGAGTIYVADAPITATGFSLSCKGQNFSNTVAAFTDADLLGMTSDYSAAIFWGDGKSSNGTIVQAGSGWKVVGNHYYAKRGKYTATITVRDVGGSTASATTHINVGPVK